MPEIKEVIRRLYMSRREFAERFPEISIHPAAGIDRVQIEEVYRVAGAGQSASALYIFTNESAATPRDLWDSTPLILKGWRFTSGRWLRKIDPAPTQSIPDAEQPATPG